MHRALLSVVLSLSVLLSTLAAAQAAEYTFTTIDVSEATLTAAFGINTAGQIVGHFSRPAPLVTMHGFLTSDDGVTFTAIDVPEATGTIAFRINDDGQIVGYFDDATGRHGFVTSDGATFTPINVPSATVTQAWGINNIGQIVGIFSDGVKFRGFVKDGATFTTIDIPGTRNTLARGINTAGEVVGSFSDGTRDHGFLAIPVPMDKTPPVITVSASPATLSPPNGKLVPVTVSGTITDGANGSGVQASMYQVTDEYGQIQPSSNLMLDEGGSYAFTVDLQASRNGNDRDGRHYTIVVSATDQAGNPGAASATVTVPRN
jgi:probable HAF family extracellular repeat protein